LPEANLIKKPPPAEHFMISDYVVLIIIGLVEGATLAISGARNL
jgi:hypothetical protein